MKILRVMVLIRRRNAVVERIMSADEDTAEVLVRVDGKLEKAINYNRLTGKVSVGDCVVVNTNAVHLKLGTGGHHFIICNKDNNDNEFSEANGHIIKLRYTPMQVKCYAVEEPESPYHNLLKDMDNIQGMKVIIGSLHSMLSPVVHVMKHYCPGIKIAYVMTDSACLPIAYSDTVKELKENRLIECTITSGQAFGGDYETVNIYTALLAAKHICKCDAAVVIPGPGVVGTGTKLGFSNIEEGHLIDAVNTLKGIPFIIPRISFSDFRERHIGISHHSITVLTRICYSSANIGFPIFEDRQHDIIISQIHKYNIHKKHNITFLHEDTINILEKRKVFVETMGRSIHEDVYYFRAIGAAAALLTRK